MSKMTTVMMHIETHAQLQSLRLNLSSEVNDVISLGQTIECLLKGRQAWLDARKEKILEKDRLEAERKEADKQIRQNLKLKRSQDIQNLKAKTRSIKQQAEQIES